MTFEYQGGAGSPGSVSNDSTTPAGSLFATGNGGRWSYGAGIYSQAGAGVDYGREWAGRYVVEDAQLRTLNVSGALAYRITDRLDVGAALGAQYADVDAGVAVNNAAAIYGPPGDLPDGQVKMSGSSWQPVGSIGLRYRVNDDTRIGLSWTSAVHQAPTLDVRAARLHPVLSSLVPRASSADMEFTLPQQVSLGVARQLTPATLVAVGAGWQDWSAFGDSTLTLLDRRIAMFPHGLRDTWNVSAGVRHQLSPAWALSAGAAYDSSPGKEPTMPAYFPVGEQRRVAVGAEYRQASGAVVRAALSVIDQPDVRVAPPDATWPLPGTGSFGGTVQSNRAYVFCIATDFAM
jgi:long-chain fatty acid transport protein